MFKRTSANVETTQPIAPVERITSVLGGGIIWRAKDKENYYIARFNPLENNFRLYYVRDGARKTLASTRIALTAGKWHSMKIVQHGDSFEAYLDGKKLLEGSDNLFSDAGGVGLWTKADAVTSFDNFVSSKRLSKLEITDLCVG